MRVSDPTDHGPLIELRSMGVAILPPVPGLALYTAMVALAQGDTSAFATQLATAGIISLAVSIGVALGLGVGRNAFAIVQRVAATTPP